MQLIACPFSIHHIPIFENEIDANEKLVIKLWPFSLYSRSEILADFFKKYLPIYIHQY